MNDLTALWQKLSPDTDMEHFLFGVFVSVLAYPVVGIQYTMLCVIAFAFMKVLLDELFYGKINLWGVVQELLGSLSIISYLTFIGHMKY